MGIFLASSSEQRKKGNENHRQKRKGEKNLLFILLDGTIPSRVFLNYFLSLSTLL